MQNAKKRFSAVLAAIFALVFALSVLFVVFEAEHDCAGDDCQICQTINTCLHILDDITPDPNAAVIIPALVFAVVLVIGATLICEKNNSLIALKVKLSN